MDKNFGAGGANSSLSKPSQLKNYNNANNHDSQLSFLDEDKRIQLLIQKKEEIER
jgi:hypothetical protein